MTKLIFEVLNLPFVLKVINMEAQTSYAMDGINLGLTVIFIILNGFFVAAEFALVKLTKTKIKVIVQDFVAEIATWPSLQRVDSPSPSLLFLS